MIEMIASIEATTAVQAATEVAQSGISGSITSAVGALGGALGVGLIGFKACESVGRNPEASGKVLIAEGIAILCLLMG